MKTQSRAGNVSKFSKKYTDIKKSLAAPSKSRLWKVRLCLGFLLVAIYWSWLLLSEPNLTSQWVILLIWFASLIIFLSLDFSLPNKIHLKRIFSPGFFFIMLLAILIRFAFLDIYPFAVIGDMMRDGGMDAMNLLNGQFDNIFEYGRYASHGLLIPTLSIPFYLIFGSSALVFVVLAAILSVIDIMIIYQFGERYFHKWTGFVAALVLICSPLHLYYGRTETVVIFSSLLTTLLLLFLFKYYHKQTIGNLLSLALFIGFSFNFHASARPVGIIALLITSAVLFINLLQNKQFLQTLMRVLIVIVFVFIGFGPRLKYTTIEIFFKSDAVEISNTEEQAEGWEKVQIAFEKLSTDVPKALMVYFYEPAQSHFSKNSSVVNFSLGLFFLIAIVSWLKNKRELLLLIPFIFILPLTNSALTDSVNADHRLAPLLPISALAVAYGFITINKHYWDNKYSQVAVFLITSLILISTLTVNVIDFFDKEYAHKAAFNNHPIQNYLITYTNKVLKEKQVTGDICLHLSSKSKDIFLLRHYSEQFLYFNPDVHINHTEPRYYAYDSEIYITRDCEYNSGDVDFAVYRYCENYQKFYCPDKDTKFTINIQSDLITQISQN